jgi:hypothetical protein
MLYNIEIDVKYKNIEEELVQKIDNHQNADLDLDLDLGYTKEDVLEICDELYRHEMLLVFEVNNISDKKVQSILSNIWIKIQNYPEFVKVIKKYNEKLCQMDIEQTFILLFNYTYFYNIHKCIVCMYNNLSMEKELLDLEEIINQQ